MIERLRGEQAQLVEENAPAAGRARGAAGRALPRPRARERRSSRPCARSATRIRDARRRHARAARGPRPLMSRPRRCRPCPHRPWHEPARRAGRDPRASATRSAARSIRVRRRAGRRTSTTKMRAAADVTAPAHDSLRLAVLAALNIADELFRCRDAAGPAPSARSHERTRTVEHDGRRRARRTAPADGRWPARRLPAARVLSNAFRAVPCRPGRMGLRFAS